MNFNFLFVSYWTQLYQNFKINVCKYVLKKKLFIILFYYDSRCPNFKVLTIKVLTSHIKFYKQNLQIVLFIEKSFVWTKQIRFLTIFLTFQFLVEFIHGHFFWFELVIEFYQKELNEVQFLIEKNYLHFQKVLKNSTFASNKRVI